MRTGGEGIRNPKVPFTYSEQLSNENLQQKCAVCVHRNNSTPEILPTDLAQITAVWPELPEHIKQSTDSQFTFRQGQMIDTAGTIEETEVQVDNGKTKQIGKEEQKAIV
ncbi:MAG: hypothetical protein ABSF37_11375 [Sedimentisphaerales bacterium]|jgi:hypothetical protein